MISLEWKTVSSNLIKSDTGGFTITWSRTAAGGMEFRLIRGQVMEGRMECRDNVVDRTDTIAELKKFAETLDAVARRATGGGA